MKIIIDEKHRNKIEQALAFQKRCKTALLSAERIIKIAEKLRIWKSKIGATWKELHGMVFSYQAGGRVAKAYKYKNAFSACLIRIEKSGKLYLVGAFRSYVNAGEKCGGLNIVSLCFTPSNTLAEKALINTARQYIDRYI